MKKIISILMIFLLIPTISHAQFVRKNDFMDKTGAERTAHLKKFQATMNLNVTGTLDANTKAALYTENFEVFDEISNPPSKGKWIAVNKTKRILTLYEGSKSIGKYPVTLGTTQTPTPSAKGRIISKHINPAWGGMGGKYTPAAADDPKNPLGERWMGLAIPGKNGYGIHGNIKPHQIGGYFSNGCIRMFNYDIENLVFPEVKTGIPVWIGTEAELGAWGLKQYSRVAKKAPVPKVEAPQTPAPVTKPAEEKPQVVERPVENIVDYESLDILEY